jgi:hypothetical protein
MARPILKPPGHMIGRTLRAVVPVALSRTISAIEIAVNSLEVYEDGSVIVYRTRSLKNEFRPVDFRDLNHGMLDFELEDDQGKSYRCVTTRASQDDRQTRGEARVTPGFTDVVKELKLTVRLIEWNSSSQVIVRPESAIFAISLPPFLSQSL